MLQGILEESATKKYPLGYEITLGDRKYVYGHVDAERQARAAYAVLPKIYYGETGVPAAQALAGARTITLTAVADVAVNQFADGILSKAGGGGGGYGVNYRVKSNTGCLAGGTYVVTLYDAIITTIPITDTITMFRSPWANVVCMRQRVIDGVATDLRKTSWVGIPNRFIQANYYCWLQRSGPCMVVPAGGTEGVADDERMMIFQEDGSVSKPDYATPHEQQLAGYVLPITTAGAIPDLLEIWLAIA
jgi:hypothetical protein